MGRVAMDLDREEIVQAAIGIFREQGLAAVSMRNVGQRIGVSPIPLYRRIGNKEALLQAMADTMLAQAIPVLDVDQPWQSYALEWAIALRDRLRYDRDVIGLLGNRREALVEVSTPLIEALTKAGFESDAAVQACRLLMWAIIGFVVIESHEHPRPPKRSRKRPGGTPGGVDEAEVDALFTMNVQYLTAGLDNDRSSRRPPPRKAKAVAATRRRRPKPTTARRPD
jgi:TetR/AcrR family tetracycline transcriptional repressor